MISLLVKRVHRSVPVIWMLLLLLMGCNSSPKPEATLGEGAKVLAQSKYANGIAMLGILPSGELVMAVAPDRGEVTRRVVTLRQDRPTQVVMAGTSVVVGRAPAGAVRYVLMTDTGEVLKGKVENGAYLAVWDTLRENPAFALSILGEKGDEMLRWPPPGGLPAA